MYKICLVEDETDLARLVKSYLEKENYEVICFEKGQDVIDCKDTFHLYILDIMLKDEVTGYDIIKHIRKENEDVLILQFLDKLPCISVESFLKNHYLK